MCFMKVVIALLMDTHKILRLFSSFFLYEKTGQLDFSLNKNPTLNVPCSPQEL